MTCCNYSCGQAEAEPWVRRAVAVRSVQAWSGRGPALADAWATRRARENLFFRRRRLQRLNSVMPFIILCYYIILRLKFLSVLLERAHIPP